MASILFKYIMFLTFILGTPTFAQANQCAQIFGAESQRQVDKNIELMEKWYDGILNQSVIKNKVHPKSKLLSNMDGLGTLEKEFNKLFPVYNTTKSMLLRMNNNPQSVTFSSFQRVFVYTTHSYKKLSQKYPNNELFHFAALDTIKNLQEIYSRIEQFKQDEKLKEEQEKRQDQEDKDKDEAKDKDEDEKEGDEPQGKPKQKQQQRQQQQKQEKQKKQKDKDQEEEEDPPLDEDGHDKYQARNKDLQADSGGKNKPFYGIHVSTPVVMSVLKQNIYNNADESGEWSKSHSGRRSIPKMKTPGQFADNYSDWIYMDNKAGLASVSVLYPYKYTPVLGNYNGKYIVKENRYKEEYIVESIDGSPLPRDLKIWLEKTPKINLTRAEISELTQKSQISNQAWPDHVLHGIQVAREKGKNSPYVIAETLSKWFQDDGPYLYNSRNKDKEKEYDQVQENLKHSKDPLALALAKEKMFNCDGAAMIGTTLLRDFFNIPVRPIGGRPLSGSLANTNPIINVVNLKDPRHAWVEVFINGEWIPFDFTPNKNNPESDSSSKKDKINKPNDPRQKKKEQKEKKEQKQKKDKGEKSDSEKSEGSESGGSEGESGKAQQGQKDIDQTVNNNSNDRIEGDKIDQKSAEKAKAKRERKKAEAQNETGKKQNDSDKDKKEEKEAKSESESKSKEDQGTGEKKVVQKNFRQADLKDDLSMIPKNFDSPLGALVQTHLGRSLNVLHTKEPYETKNYFNAVEFPKEAKSYRLGASLILNKALDPFYRDNDKPLQKILIDAKNAIFKDSTTAYAKLKIISDFYRKIETVQPLNEKQTQFVKEIESVLNYLMKFKHKNSSQMKTVETLIKNLPGDVTKKLILDQHEQALQIGSQDQQALFNEITDGKWAGAYQASLVNKHFNFFLNSEKEYRARRIQTLLRSFVREKRSEGLVLAEAKDIANIQKWIFDPEPNPDPIMSLLSNLVQDKQYMMAYRQMMDSPGSANPIERKHTNIFFDISGSMGGDKATVQASAIAALVDRALSEKDPFGKPLHTVILFPFGDDVGAPIFIESPEQALSVIHQFLSRPTDSNQGTQFQPCFDKHFEMIRQYSSAEFKKSGASRLNLKKANMILITDGEADVNVAKVKKDLEELPDYIKTYFNLVTLGNESSNDKLLQIIKATNSEKSQSMVTNISSKQLSDFINESANPEVDPNAFIYDKSQGDISLDVVKKVQNMNFPQVSDAEIAAELGSLGSKIKGVASAKQMSSYQIKAEIDQVSKVLRSSMLPQNVKQMVAVKILKNYPKWTHRQLDQLSYLEEEMLIRLVEAGSGK